MKVSCAILFCFFSSAPGSQIPGMVIDYSAPASGQYLGSPSIAILPNGYYVASHDYFGSGPQLYHTRIFLSLDQGKTWQPCTELQNQFWSSLFVHKKKLYLLGTNKENGFIIIRRSDDNGHTWTNPVDAEHGLLFSDSEYHCGAMPIIEHNGRLWRAMEERNPPQGWGVNFLSFVISTPVDADLLKAASWTASSRLRYNPDWGGTAWLEGNVVVNPQGQLVNILRNHYPQDDRAALIHISADGRIAVFDPHTGFIQLPGAAKKFTIRYDKKSKQYWSLSNAIRPQDRGGNVERTRNHLALISSKDLINWSIRATVLYDPDVKISGFQYADWQFDGKDLIAVIRTALDDGRGSPPNCHDSNYLLFYRIKNFRNLN